MKQRLEFPLFYLLWVVVCLALVLSFSPEHQPALVAVGISTLPLLLGFVYANSGRDTTVCVLLRPLLFMLVATILVSAIVSTNGLMLCALGVQSLILWRVERGYTYEYAYQS